MHSFNTKIKILSKFHFDFNPPKYNNYSTSNSTPNNFKRIFSKQAMRMEKKILSTGGASLKKHQML